MRQIGIDPHVEMWDVWHDCPAKSDGGVLTCELAADDVMFVRYGGL